MTTHTIRVLAVPVAQPRQRTRVVASGGRQFTQNYTPTKGANFETYAGIRIRGAMLDEARKTNWTPRSTFRHAKQVSQAIRSIENRTGRDARGQEVAEALGVSIEDYHRMVESAASSRPSSSMRPPGRYRARSPVL